MLLGPLDCFLKFKEPGSLKKCKKSVEMYCRGLQGLSIDTPNFLVKAIILTIVNSFLTHYYKKAAYINARFKVYTTEDLFHFLRKSALCLRS